MIFISLALILSAFCLFFAYVSGYRPSKFASLPRSVWPGVIIGLPCLVWSAWHACIMLEGGLAKYHPIVWTLVPVTAILAYFFLDYLFARATGGFFILAANELIRQAFIYNIAWRPLYSIICLVLGVCGLFMLGLPWRMRDAIELAAKNSKIGRGIAAAFAVAALVLSVLSFT